MNINDLSEQWRNENPHIKKMSEKLPIDESNFARSQRQLNCEFKVVKFMTQTTLHLDKLYKNPDQFAYNRTSHILTFDPTRVKLGPNGKQDQVENYINANYVEVEGKRIIATQGPMQSTFYNFWRMVEENKVEEIFMLCTRVEKTKPKCDPYWLYDGIKDDGVKKYDIQVGEEVNKKNIITRKIEWKNIGTGREGVVTHYLLKDWSDGERPGENIKDDVLELVNKAIQSIVNERVPVVHCSAGVGRTGTFIAMMQLYMQIREKKPISIFETVRKLREHRWGMVYTQSQYDSLYDFAIKQIKMMGSDSGEDYFV